MENNKMTKQMQEFLISAYFGEVKEENVKMICAQRAYFDLARRIPYLYSNEELKKMSKEEKEKFENRKTEFKNNIYNLLINIKKDDTPYKIIDRVHEDVKKYDDLFKEDVKFGYGLCQKWVNMTLKYLWLFDVCPIDKKELHAPIDSYIIHASMKCKKSEGNSQQLDIEVNGVNQDTAWSKMDKETYKELQEELKKAIRGKDYDSVIEWENVAWIEQAQLEA